MINLHNRLRQGQAVRFNDLLGDVGQRVGEADTMYVYSVRSIHKVVYVKS